MELTRKQLLEIYDIVFSSMHSDGWKESEVRSMLYTKTYWFMEPQNDNWRENLSKYFKSINYNEVNIDDIGKMQREGFRLGKNK